MKSTVSREGNICKGPGAGLIVRWRKGKFQSDKRSTQQEEVCKSRPEE